MSHPPAPYLVGSPSVTLMQCPVAGFQHHGGEACWSRLRIDHRLALQREPGNRHDPRAITVQWEGVMLGYVPREANYALSQMMDRGAHAEARVVSLRAGGDPWQRVMMEITVAAAGTSHCERPAPSGPIALWPSIALAPPPLQLARAVGAITAPGREKALLVLRDSVPEIASRLARPVLGLKDEDRREVRLWNLVALEIGSDGRGLEARYVEGPAAAGGPSVTADLRRPLGADGWIACFVPVISAVCARHGLTKEDLPEPLRRWIGASLQLTFEGRVDFEALRKAALAFLAPDPLTRSLANRIFGGLDSRLRGNDDARLRGNDEARLRGNDDARLRGDGDAGPTAEAFNWVGARAPALALTAIEQPAMLPFLRLVYDDKRSKAAADPLAALRERLLAEGLEPAAWKKLLRWGFGAFERMGEAWWKPIAFARFANLLHHLEAQEPPPPDFAPHALRAARHGQGPHDKLDFERHPLWFMRALLRQAERAKQDIAWHVVRDDLLAAVDWLLETRAEPDANQQRAGWRWIMEQARAHREARERALAAPWTVPVAGMEWGPYRVVAIASAAELAAEAQAMKNCLASYEDACRSGEVIVYSIRERSTGARIACFAAGRDDDGRSWHLIDAAGKRNAAVDEELERIGHAMVVKLNGGRGGDVVPF